MNAVMKPIIDDICTLVRPLPCTVCTFNPKCTCSLSFSHSLSLPCYPFIQEQGHAFTIQGTSRIFRGTVAIISADNPASAALGGFKESTSAYKPCRECTGRAESIKEMVNIWLLVTQLLFIDFLLFLVFRGLLSPSYTRSAP